MELSKIEALLDQYFEGVTTLEEEQIIKEYFSNQQVAPHLEQYKLIFSYFEEERKLKIIEKTAIKKKPLLQIISIAASVVVLLSVATFAYYDQPQQDLGTFDDPEIAFRETQKALNMLSGNVNKGIRSVEYVEEYENSKNLIFKQ